MSLMLDMSSLGSVEPIQPVCTPRDITLKFLRTSSHVLRREELQQRAQSLTQLQEEFSVRCFPSLSLLTQGTAGDGGGGLWQGWTSPREAASPAVKVAGKVMWANRGEGCPRKICPAWPCQALLPRWPLWKVSHHVWDKDGAHPRC